MSEEKGLFAEFYTKPVKQEDTGQFEDVLYVRIHIKGSKNAIQDQLAKDTDKLRFPHAWGLYKESGGNGACGGTPLDKLPIMSPSIELNLKNLGINNIEDLAEIDLNGSMNITGGQHLKKQAKDYLKMASQVASVNFAAQEETSPVNVEEMQNDTEVQPKSPEETTVKPVPRVNNAGAKG